MLSFSKCIKEECMSNERVLRTVHILPIWDNGTKIPDGIRIYFFSMETNKFVQDNLDATGGYTDIRDGVYRLLMYNNDSEKIMFRNISKYETFEAYTNKISRPSFVNPAPGEETFDQPDVLWAACIDSLVISDKTKEIRLYPKFLVHKYYGRIEAEGLEYVKQIRGAITGQQSSVILKDKTTGNNPSTLFFDAQKDEKEIRFVLRSFGIMHKKGSQSENQKHFLTLEFLLSHGYIKHDFEITEKMDTIPDEGTIFINNKIVIPPDTTGGNDGGFNANVGNWEEVIYPIPL